MKVLTFVLLTVLGLRLVAGIGEEIRPEPPRPPRVFVPGQVPAPTTHDQDRAPAEGLPVPIYPGTRVTRARIEPPRSQPQAPRGTNPWLLASTDASASRTGTVSGQLCATEPRARDNARVHLEREVTDWLAPDVPASWNAPAHLIDRLITRTRIEPVVRDYGTLYEATLDVDLSPPRRQEIVEAYQRELVRRRMATLGGGLGFVLACLAALSGYIRADEATRGYYTYWLRAIAAAGVGASGALLYQFLA
jgi:hypothetical protein